jgi:alpha-tubulin suppressor-like RCC1 family protein
MALKSDGTVWAWGVDSDGFLGFTTTTNCGDVDEGDGVACSPTPRQVSSLQGAIAIAAGGTNLAVIPGA